MAALLEFECSSGYVYQNDDNDHYNEIAYFNDNDHYIEIAYFNLNSNDYNEDDPDKNDFAIGTDTSSTTLGETLDVAKSNEKLLSIGVDDDEYEVS